MPNEKLLEAFAEQCHIQWAGWTKHQIESNDLIHVAGWMRQIATPYSELSEQEKDSDRKCAAEFITILNRIGNVCDTC
jgi:hypothetical protein